MKIVEVKERNKLLIERLFTVWENSVKESFQFLSDDEIEDIRKRVPQIIKEVNHLVIVQDENELPVAFMGVNEPDLEMLFISPDEAGKGLGKKLLSYGIENCSITEIAVNEQNPLAKGFYERMGFSVYKRTDKDKQGNPHPILYMRLDLS